jgi:hypothetical protein
LPASGYCAMFRDRTNWCSWGIFRIWSAGVLWGSRMVGGPVRRGCKTVLGRHLRRISLRAAVAKDNGSTESSPNVPIWTVLSQSRSYTLRFPDPLSNGAVTQFIFQTPQFIFQTHAPALRQNPGVSLDRPLEHATMSPPHSGVSPEHSAVSPPHSGVSPEHSAVSPPYSGVFPEYSGVSPSYSRVSP